MVPRAHRAALFGEVGFSALFSSDGHVEELGQKTFFVPIHEEDVFYDAAFYPQKFGGFIGYVVIELVEAGIGGIGRMTS